MNKKGLRIACASMNKHSYCSSPVNGLDYMNHVLYPAQTSGSCTFVCVCVCVCGGREGVYRTHPVQSDCPVQLSSLIVRLSVCLSLQLFLRNAPILMKLYTAVLYEDNPHLNNIKGDNSRVTIICEGWGIYCYLTHSSSFCLSGFFYRMNVDNGEFYCFEGIHLKQIHLLKIRV